MQPHSPPEDLIRHLTTISRLNDLEATRILQEVYAYFREPMEAFVTRRHGELQRDGLTNREIYERITTELAARRFPAPSLTQRQIRRLIYG